MHFPVAIVSSRTPPRTQMDHDNWLPCGVRQIIADFRGVKPADSTIRANTGESVPTRRHVYVHVPNRRWDSCNYVQSRERGLNIEWERSDTRSPWAYRWTGAPRRLNGRRTSRHVWPARRARYVRRADQDDSSIDA